MLSRAGVALCWVFAATAAAAAPPFTDPRCSYAAQQVLVCINGTHYGFLPCTSLKAGATAGLPFTATLEASACRPGFRCNPSTGSCAAPDIATHLLRSVDYQIVETVVSTSAVA